MIFKDNPRGGFLCNNEGLGNPRYYKATLPEEFHTISPSGVFIPTVGLHCQGSSERKLRSASLRGRNKGSHRSCLLSASYRP